MGTRATITIVPSQKNPNTKTIFQLLFERLEEIEKKMGRTDPDSLVAKMNRLGSKEPVPVDPEMMFVLNKSFYIFNLTNGKFDVTIGPLIRLWGFDTAEKRPRVPRRREIMSRLHQVNFRNLELDQKNQTVSFKTPGMGIDLGGVAKGYAVDQLLKLLLEMGIQRAIVEIGGDVKTLGLKPDNLLWVVGIQHPRDRGKLLAILDSDGRAIATSGDYEKNFVEEAILYHHILNPKTGYPARKCQSVTVLANSALHADALSTGIFVMGTEMGMKLIEELPGVDGVIVDISGKIWISTGLKNRLRYVG